MNSFDKPFNSWTVDDFKEAQKVTRASKQMKDIELEINNNSTKPTFTGWINVVDFFNEKTIYSDKTCFDLLTIDGEEKHCWTLHGTYFFNGGKPINAARVEYVKLSEY